MTPSQEPYDNIAIRVRIRTIALTLLVVAGLLIGVLAGRRLFVPGDATPPRPAAQEPDLAETQLALGISAITMSRPEDAAAALRHAQDARVELPEPMRAAADAAQALVDGGMARAWEVLDDALRQWPDDPRLNLLAGFTAAISCPHFDPNGTRDHLEAALAAGLGGAEIRALLQQSYEMTGLHNWSLSSAMERLTRHPEETAAIAEVGRARIARGEYGDALLAADDIVRAGEDVFGHGLAPAFILSGRYDEIAAMYDPELESAVRADANALTHLHAGIDEVWRGRLARAAMHFERGPEFLNAAWQPARRALFQVLLSRVHLLTGRNQEARASLEEAMRQEPEEPLLEYLLGAAELAAGREAEAMTWVEALAIERRRGQPGWSAPWERLLTGEVALAHGDVSAAIAAFRDAWDMQMHIGVDCIAGHVEAYYLDALGRAYLAAGRPEDALQQFEQILALGLRGLHQPDVAMLAHQRSGLALQALGRDADAKPGLERYRRWLQGS